MASAGQSPRIPRSHDKPASLSEGIRDEGSLQPEIAKPQAVQHQEVPVFLSPRRQTSGNLTPRLHRPTQSDMWSPRTTVIHDVSEDESSGGDECSVSLENQDLPHSEGAEANSTPVDQKEHMEEDQRLSREEDDGANDRLWDVANVGNSSSSIEFLPVSRHVPYKASISSESVGEKNTVVPREGEDMGQELLQKPDWSGETAEQRQSRSIVSIPESTPGLGGSRESFEGTQKPTATDLVVLAQEVQRLEIELELSRQEVKTLRENEAKPTSKPQSVNKGEQPGSSKTTTETPSKACISQRMGFVNRKILGSEDAPELSHLQARLMKAERCVEAEREKASRLELKYKIETSLIVDGQRALEDMSKVKKDLLSTQSKSEKLERALEDERKKVNSLKEELSKLVSASSTQSEDQHNLQHALEESLKDARQARIGLSEMTEKYKQATSTRQATVSEAELINKQHIAMKSELAAAKKKLEELTKENLRLDALAAGQAMKIQRLLETPLHSQTAHSGDTHLSNPPDPPSSDPITDSSHNPSSVHSMELLALAQEVERLEKELAFAKAAKEESASGDSQLRIQGMNSIETRDRGAAMKTADGEHKDNIEMPPSSANHASSEVTVVAPLRESGKQGWGRGLWGFLAGSDLTQG